MLIIDLVYNLSVLVGLSVLSGFIDSRFDKKTNIGKIFQGILFGVVAIIGMHYPFNLYPGVIFDGRSIVISLCTLFFGPVSGLISSVLSIAFRIYLGGSGALTGSLVIAISFIIGSVFFFLRKNYKINLSKRILYLFGILVSASMMILMLTLPSNTALEVFNTITFTVMLTYPIITLVMGQVLLNQEVNKNFLKRINKERSLYLTTIDSMGEAVIIVNKNGNVLNINPVAEKLTGWSRNEAFYISLEKVFRIIDEYSRDKLISPLTKVLNKDVVIGFSYYALLVNKNGEETPISYSASPIKSEKDETTGVVLVFRDQTEIRRQQRMVIESEERFRSIVEGAPDPIFIQTDKKFAYLNPAALKLFGAQETYELIDKPVLERFHPYFHNVVRERIRQLNFERKAVDRLSDLKCIRLDGKEVWVETSAEPIFYEGKNGALVFVRDITERKQAVDAVRESEARFDLLAEQSRTVIWEIDPSGLYTYVSNASKTVWGFNPEELVGKLHFYDLHPEVGREEFMSTSFQVINNKSSFVNFENKIKTKIGTIIWVTTNGVPNFDDKGNLISYSGSDKDITEKKLAEVEIQKNHDLLINLTDLVPGVVYQYQLFPDGRSCFPFASEGMNTIYECTPEEVSIDATPVFSRLHPDDLEYVSNLIMDSAKTLEMFHCEFRVILPRQGLRWRLSDARPQRLEDGSVLWHGIISDITERKNAELNLLENEEKMRSIFRVAPTGIGIVSNRVFVEVNERVCQMVGYSQEELIGQSARMIYPSNEDFEFVGSEKYKMIAEKGTGSVETKWKTKDGKILNVILSSTPIDKDNLSKGVIFTALDITDIKNAEEALKESEERFRNLFNDNLAVMLLISADTRKIVDANTAAVNYYGWSKDELLSMRIDDINISPVAMIKEKMEKYRSLRQINFEFRHRRANGRESDVEIYSSKVVIQGKEYLHSIIHDITEKKLIESELKKRSMAVEQSPVSIVITDIQGNIEYVNSSFSKITGYTYSDAVGQNPRFLQSGEQIKSFYENLWSTILAGKSWSGVFHNKKKNGELFWESAIISPITNEIGKITHFVAVKEDITEKVEKEIELNNYRQHLEKLVEERTTELDKLNSNLFNQLKVEKELKEKLNEALSKEKELNDLKTKFIATVSHEFRTPLAALFSSSQMIQRYSKKWTEEKLNEHYGRISSTVNYLTQLLDDVLMISRADREIITNKPERVELDELIKSYEDEVKPSVTPNHDFVISNLSQKKTIFVDKKLLRQIVVNLLTNAFKYSPEGGKVEMIIRDEYENLEIKVSDEGLGINEEELPYIFDPFYRTNNSMGIQGSGLGLNIAKRAIEILGGKISVESKPNSGTTFNLRIPIYEE